MDLTALMDLADAHLEDCITALVAERDRLREELRPLVAERDRRAMRAEVRRRLAGLDPARVLAAVSVESSEAMGTLNKETVP